MFKTQKRNAGAAALLLAAITLLAVTAQCADEKIKKNLNNPPTDAAEIFHRITELPGDYVIQQATKQISLGEIGIETILEIGDFQYTIWVWEWRNHNGVLVPWARVFIRPLNPKNKEAPQMFADAYLDGYVDASAPQDGPATPEFFGALDYTPEMRETLGYSFPETPMNERQAARESWQPKYNKVLLELKKKLQQLKDNPPKKKPDTSIKPIDVSGPRVILTQH
ncbi:MAG: hypothetical protein V4664_01305 [Patescibacteria group bacterium]